MNLRIAASFTTGLLCLLLFWNCGSLKIKRFNQANSNANWPVYGGTPARLHHTANQLAPPLDNLWIHKTSSAVNRALLAVDGILFAPTLDGKIDAVDIREGEKIGRIESEEGYEVTCAYGDTSLFMATAYGAQTLARYDLKSGEYVWKTDAGHIETEPVVTEEGLYIAALYNHVDKYRTDNGERIWRFKTDGQIRSSPAVGEDVLVVGCDKGTVYAIHTKTGNLKWRFETGANIAATPVLWQNLVLVGSTDSLFYALDLKQGDMRWLFKADSPLYQPAAADGEHVVFGAGSGTFYCLTVEDGREKWRFRANSVISTAPVISGNIVYFGSLDKHYYGLHLTNGEQLWSYETEGRIRTSPVVWGPYLFGASEDRHLYAFSNPDRK